MGDRETPEDEILRNLKHKCEGCSNPVMFEFAYCGYCGTINPDFDEETFERHWKMSIYKKRERDCNENGHKRLVATSSPDSIKISPHCNDCGEKLA